MKRLALLLAVAAAYFGFASTFEPRASSAAHSLTVRPATPFISPTDLHAAQALREAVAQPRSEGSSIDPSSNP
jgi:hypothetical protein